MSNNTEVSNRVNLEFVLNRLNTNFIIWEFNDD